MIDRRDASVRRIIFIEGLANLAVLVAKTTVGLATLLMVLAVEIVLHAVRGDPVEIGGGSWELGVMIGVLLVNIGLTIWQRRWAKRLGSAILKADSDHTLSDVLTTIAVVAGWQLSI